MTIKGIFVTGTDTGVGKTLVSCELLLAARRRGIRPVGMKPIASGANVTTEGLRNDDALALSGADGEGATYGDVNPYCFAAAIAPHIAARESGVSVELARIDASASRLASQRDWLLVEGVGGWLAPLSTGLTVRDLARHMALPVVLVVGLRLGCLNHAALSFDSIQRSGLVFAGWIASQIEPTMRRIKQNLATLAEILEAPPLAVLRWRPDETQRRRQMDAAIASLIDG